MIEAVSPPPKRRQMFYQNIRFDKTNPATYATSVMEVMHNVNKHQKKFLVENHRLV